MRTRHLLLDPDRVHLRALAVVASSAGRLRAEARLGAWLEARVDQAIDELLERSSSDTSPATGAWADLADPLGLEPRAARAACARLNRLPDAERELFFRVVLERRSLDELARTSGRSLTEIARLARCALDSVRVDEETVTTSDGSREWAAS